MAYALEEAEKELQGMGLNLTNYTYFGETPVGTVITEKLKKVSFNGVSVSVRETLVIAKHVGSCLV